MTMTLQYSGYPKLTVKWISPLDPGMFGDGRGAAVQPRPGLLLLPAGLVGVLLQPLREPLPVQVQRRLERLDPVPVAVVALLQLVGQLQSIFIVAYSNSRKSLDYRLSEFIPKELT